MHTKPRALRNLVFLLYTMVVEKCGDQNPRKCEKNWKVRIAYRPEWCIMTCCYLYGMGNKAAIMLLYTHSVHVPSPNRLILQQIFLVLVTYTVLFSSVLAPSVKFHSIFYPFYCTLILSSYLKVMSSKMDQPKLGSFHISLLMEVSRRFFLKIRPFPIVW
jgi:hypothetical protein